MPIWVQQSHAITCHHTASSPQALNEKIAALEALRKEADELRYQKEQLHAELTDVVESMTKEEEVKSKLQDQVCGQFGSIASVRAGDKGCLAAVLFTVLEGWGTGQTGAARLAQAESAGVD